MPRGRLVAAVLASLALASCAREVNLSGRDPAPAAGNVTGSVSVPPASTAPTGPGGGIFGGSIGPNLDERDRQRAFAAEIQALEFGEPGNPVGWRSDGGGRRGTVVPGAYYEGRGTRCRDISHTVYIDNRPQIARGTACRNPDGTWSPVS